MAADEMVEVFGEPISVYTREQAIEDGILVDVSEWGSPRQMTMGFNVPVAMTIKLWRLVDVDSKKGYRGLESTRGRAHDVLWMGSLALCGAMKREQYSALYKVIIGRKTEVCRIVLDGDGVTIGLRDDEW